MRIPIASLDQAVLEHRRGQLDESCVRYYMDHPEEIRDVLVYENPGNGERIVVNGCHRTEAALRLAHVELDVELRPGSRQDALRYRNLAERRPWSEVERERARLDYVIELEEAALLALPWDAHPGLRSSMERTLDENVAKRGRLDRPPESRAKPGKSESS